MAGKKAIIYGGRGALGSKIVEYFKGHQWWTLSIDYKRQESADANIILEVANSTNLSAQAEYIEQETSKILKGSKVDAILCVAGGWAGGNLSSQDFIQSCETMWQQSVWSSLIASKLAHQHLNESGLLQLTGAKAALTGTSGMIGYGMAKAAVHHLVQSLKSKKSGLPKDSTVLAILPVTLDTPANRQAMPQADHSTWTPLEFVANLLYTWSENKNNRPATGSLVHLVTKDGKTDLEGHTPPVTTP